MDAQNKLYSHLYIFLLMNALIGLIWNGFSLRVSVFITSILLLWKQDKYAIFPMYFPEVQSPPYLQFFQQKQRQQTKLLVQKRRNTSEKYLFAYNQLSFRIHKIHEFIKISIICGKVFFSIHAIYLAFVNKTAPKKLALACYFYNSQQ